VVGIAEDDGTLDPSVMVAPLDIPEVESTIVEPSIPVVVTDTVSLDDGTIIFDEDETLVVAPGTAELRRELALTIVLLVEVMVERLDVCMAVSTSSPEIVGPAIASEEVDILDLIALLPPEPLTGADEDWKLAMIRLANETKLTLDVVEEAFRLEVETDEGNKVELMGTTSLSLEEMVEDEPLFVAEASAVELSEVKSNPLFSRSSVMLGTVETDVSAAFVSDDEVICEVELGSEPVNVVARALVVFTKGEVVGPSGDPEEEEELAELEVDDLLHTEVASLPEVTSAATLLLGSVADDPLAASPVSETDVEELADGVSVSSAMEEIDTEDEAVEEDKVSVVELEVQEAEGISVIEEVQTEDAVVELVISDIELAPTSDDDEVEIQADDDVDAVPTEVSDHTDGEVSSRAVFDSP